MNGRIQNPGPPSEIHSLPIIGNIKVGKKNAKGLPESTDYFICDSKYNDRYFIPVFGKTPDSIQILFISDDPGISCNERFECRDKNGRLAGYGDGKKYYLFHPDKNRYFEEEDREVIKRAGKWDRILTLRFIIPAIRGVFGLFQFSTKGKESSLPQIRDTFDLVKNQANTVINIPFDLQVKKVKSQKPGANHKFPVVNLIPNIGQENLALVRDYLSQGNDIRALGMIDESKIKLIENKNGN